MKHLFKISIFSLLFFSQTLSAVEVINEQFSSNISGWSVTSSSKVYWSSSYSGSMFIDRKDKGYRTYNLGASYANQTLTVNMEWCATNAWESNNDYLRVRVNGSTVESDYDGGGCQTTSFTADADSNGDFKIEFSPRTSSNNEDAYIMWFTVQGTPIGAPPGCDNSLDTNANNSLPGTIVTGMNNIVIDTTDCISGYSDDSQSSSDKIDYYRFTVAVAGTLNITTSSPNGEPYHLRIGSTQGGTEYYGDSTDTIHNISSINLGAGATIYIYLRETGSELDVYQLDFDFVVNNSTTTWIKNAAGTSAYTSPSDYTDNSDITETLTIAGATSINVTVTGVTEQDYDFLYITDSNGITKTYDGTINDTYLAAGPTVTIRFVSDYSVQDSGVQVSISGVVPTPPVITGIPNQSILQGLSFSLGLSTYTSEADGDPITYSTTALPPGLTLNTSTGVISGIPNTAGIYTIIATATDKDGSDTDSFTITVTLPPVDAVDDPYFLKKNQSLTDNIFTNDSGYQIQINTVSTLTLNPSNVSQGTFSLNHITGALSYTPPLDYLGDVSFTYTLIDVYGTVSGSATVTININDNTDYTEGLHDFELINPESTRNIIGNYTIAGNTIECITTRQYVSSSTTNPSDFQNTCTSSNLYNDNNYMSQYLDVDGNTGIGSRTWNSSSSNIILPDRQSGVIWAGLFWQGGLHHDRSYAQRIGSLNNSGNIVYDYVTSDGNINLENSDANKVLFKYEDDANYTPIKAYTMYYDKAFGSRGGYYAAYADVTSFVKSKNLDGATHTFTLANLSATEGQQTGTGNFAGWSLVVIYNENAFDLNSAARNISIYNGYTTIYSGSGTRNVHISGFKLPTSGPVRSQFAAFAGEGEQIYGKGSNEYDQMFISDQSDLSNPQDMPGAIDPSNIFDAILSGVSRNSGLNNDIANANGIDIENYDVSDIMTTYRDANTLINDVYIGLYSNSDYVTPSMMAFSAELYKPKICYDYTVQNGTFDITEAERNVSSSSTSDLSINIALQNLEGDFDLINSSLAVTFSPTGPTFTKALYAPNNVNTLIPAIHTTASTTAFPQIAIGENISVAGGTLKRNQLYFSEFTYTLTDAYTGSFDIDFNTTIDFGSGAVPTLLSTKSGTIARCPQSNYYNPAKGSFNVERTGSAGVPASKYPLFTQIVGKDFDIDVVSYGGPDYTSEAPIQNYVVDLELISASTFSDDNATFICSNPNPNIIQNLTPTIDHLFVSFPQSGGVGTSRVSLASSTFQTNTALRNAVFRMWYIVDTNGSLVPHNCTSESDNACFEDVYDTYLRADDTILWQKADGTTASGFCQSCTSYSNNVTGDSGCYSCLRDFFSKAVCSRDNFAIRPETFRLNIKDTNNTKSSTSVQISANNDFPTNVTGTNYALLAAEYGYMLEGNGTVYNTNTALRNAAALDYNTDINATLLYTPTAGMTCTDTSNQILANQITFSNGQINANLDINHTNAGIYNLHLEDVSWTEVDQNNALFGTNDCILNSGITSASTTGQSGCNTVSDLQTFNASTSNHDLGITFLPYSFRVSTILPILPNASNILYSNNLNTNNILQLPMSVNLIGNLTAVGKTGGVLSNFTTGCVATAVQFDINRTFARNGVNVSEGNITSIDLNAIIPVNNNIFFQRVYQTSNGTNFYAAENNSTTTLFTIPASEFSNNLNGSAQVNTYYNLNHLVTQVMEPIQMTLLTKEVNGSAASTSADLGTHIPTTEGNGTIGITETIFYGRVATSQVGPFLVPRSNITTSVPLYAEVYCNANCPTFGLSQQSLRDPGIWWVNTNHNSANNDGSMTTITDPGANSPLAIAPNNTVAFNVNTGSRTNIAVTINANALRPYQVILNIGLPNWLNYNPTNSLRPAINFLGGGGWAGKGNTGNVVNTNPYYDSNNKRTEW
jgi:hypothetical protein